MSPGQEENKHPTKDKINCIKQDKTKTDYQIQSPGQDNSALSNRGEEIEADSMIKAKRATRDSSLQEKQQTWKDIESQSKETNKYEKLKAKRMKYLDKINLLCSIHIYALHVHDLI